MVPEGKSSGACQNDYRVGQIRWTTHLLERRAWFAREEHSVAAIRHTKGPIMAAVSSRARTSLLAAGTPLQIVFQLSTHSRARALSHELSSSFPARTENGGSKPDKRSALLDRWLEIIAHAHRERRQLHLVFRSDAIAQLR